MEIHHILDKNWVLLVVIDDPKTSGLSGKQGCNVSNVAGGALVIQV